jgi:predicted nucleic acid-binding protein
MTMIAIDASSFRRYLDGIDAADTRAVIHALVTGEAALPPVALAELLSDPNLAPDALVEVQSVAVMSTYRGFWHRAGFTRAALRRRFGIQAKLPDTLIAQACLDEDCPLITHDDGFRRQFAHAGLKLLSREV